MRRMSMSKLRSLSRSWRQRRHEQPLGIPGHKRPSLPHRRWNWDPGRCVSRKCSSSKLRLRPGRRESDMEVDQGWHPWDLVKYKWDTTLSFRLRVFKQQFPLDSGQMSLTQTCTSSQYHANIPVESIPCIPHHTTQNEFKSKRNSPTSLTASKIWKPGNAKDEHEQTTKPFKKLATKTPWAATWNPGTQKAFAPSSPMELFPRSMLVTEVFVFKASASAWPKGKRFRKDTIQSLPSI